MQRGTMKNRIVRKESKNRMPIIGKIKVGQKINRGGKEIPTSLDYFVADGNYKHIFEKKFSGANRLDIAFISDDIGECCIERMEIRKGSKLFARGDGETFEVWDKSIKKYVLRNITEESNLIEEIEKECKSKFEEILTLYFLIIGINEVFGVWKFSTKGKESSIPSIRSSFDMVLEHAGKIKLMPFSLSVEKVKSQKPESKNLFPVVTLVANIGQEYLQKLKDHIGIDSNISGMITEDKIDSAVLEIEYNDEDIKANCDIDRLLLKIECCGSIEELKNVGFEIHKLDLEPQQTDVLRKRFSIKQKELVENGSQ